MEPECSEVINGPNLGGFLGLAPDLRRLGRQGLAWLSGTQGLLLDQAFGISQRAALAATQPATASSQSTHSLHNKALSFSSRQDIPADLPRRIFSFRFLLREFVCAVVLRFRSWASGIMPVPSS